MSKPNLRSQLFLVSSTKIKTKTETFDILKLVQTGVLRVPSLIGGLRFTLYYNKTSCFR